MVLCVYYIGGGFVWFVVLFVVGVWWCGVGWVEVCCLISLLMCWEV